MTTGDDAFTDSYRVPRHGNVQSTLPFAGSMTNSPPVAGRLSPPANTNTRRLPFTVAGIGEA